MDNTMASKQLSGLRVGGYEITDRIGAGRFCIAYECRGGSQKTAAIKVLRDPEDVRYFIRETAIINAIKHLKTPHVVKFLDVGSLLYTDSTGATHPLPWIMMEKLGTSLSAHLRRVVSIKLPTALKITAGIFRGLAALHAAGIIHSDIKPSNIMFRGSVDDCVPVLVDLGSAAKVGDVKSTKVGTYMYIPPENIYLQDYSTPADIWSTMTILFEMATGDVLFDVYHDCDIKYGGGLDTAESSSDSTGCSSGCSSSESESESESDSGSDQTDSSSEANTEEELLLEQRLMRLWIRVLGPVPREMWKNTPAIDAPEPISLGKLIQRNYDMSASEISKLVSIMSRGLQYRAKERITAEKAAVLCAK